MYVAPWHLIPECGCYRATVYDARSQIVAMQVPIEAAAMMVQAVNQVHTPPVRDWRGPGSDDWGDRVTVFRSPASR
jgi:hypothetical protein